MQRLYTLETPTDHLNQTVDSLVFMVLSKTYALDRALAELRFPMPHALCPKTKDVMPLAICRLVWS